MKYKIYNDDVLEWAKTYDKAKFHALLCDPPYHLSSPVSKSGSQPGKESPYGRHNYNGSKKGFMGQTWDGGDIAFNPETWSLLGDHLYDGAFGFAFAASRNWHRMAVAIEDAGFIIHPTIFCWVQGQGFPKATNISKQLDKGKEGKVIGQKKLWGHNAGSGAGSFSKNSYEGHTGEVRYEDIYAPASELSEAWSGHRYGLQALKPSVEPIICFQKPYNGKPIDNITQTGAGALNINGARIPMQTDDEYVINTFDDGAKPFGDGAGHEYTSRKVRAPQSNPKNRQGIVGTDLGISNADIEKFQESQRLSTKNMEEQGRWPANFVVDEETANRLNQQTGTLTSGKPSGKKSADNMIYGKYKNDNVDVTGFGDSGGASRFFFNVSNTIEEADPIFYCPKASTKEKNYGLEDVEPKERSTQGRDEVRMIDRKDGKGLVPVNANIHPRANNHPTVKPISLTQWLATLLLPPDMYAPRRILVPFSGVGSEMIGAMLAGWDRILGIEMDTENDYVDMAHKRLEYYANK